MKKQDVVDLIKYHEEGNDSAFTEKALQIADDFQKSGDTYLGNYISTLVAKTNVFVPQDTPLNFQFLEEVPLGEAGQLPLPETVEDKLEGIVNAINNNMGVNKFLFEGSPGTGKTESAKTIARILNRKLLKVDFDSLVDSKLGQTSKNIARVFREINNYPYPNQIVVLLDEIDAIALDRVTKNDVREMGRATSAVLKGLDELLPGITILATTNLFKYFDPALSRRFNLIVNFDQYSPEDLIDVAVAIMNSVYQKYPDLEKNIRLFKKIINLYGNEIPLPGNLKNMIETAVAFSNVKADPTDYLRNIYQSVTNRRPDPQDLQKNGFTVREIAILTGKSKSTIGRELRGGYNE